MDDVIEHCLVALVSSGHVLLEGPPGTAKTLLVKLLSQLVSCPFKRIQFTPDLMPADLIGTNIFNPGGQQFEFRQGPLFTTFLLADEINRAPAKTQSALLEAMQERQITVDGHEYSLSDCFTVFATQNPIEHEGTYPLPEAQLDRFMFNVQVNYPPADAEIAMLQQHHHQDLSQQPIQLSPLFNETQIRQIQQQANALTVEQSIVTYVAQLTQASRQHPQIAVGVSPRAAIAWIKAAKAKAFLSGRAYVIPDDVKELAKPLLRHRLILYPQAQMEGLTPDRIIDELCRQVAPPR